MATLPNPDTYLNHFPPAQAAQFEVARNLCLAVLGATIWDILIYIPDDYKILRRSSFRPVTFCFVASRVFSLAFVALAVIEFTHPVGDCNALVVSIGSVCFLTVITTTYIFLQRVIAVYSSTRWVQITAIVLWLATCATMSTTVFAAHSAHVPGTGYCVYSVIAAYLTAAGFVFLSFDTFVFLAISYKIATAHSDKDAGITWETAVSGRNVPRISRSVLHGGQQYYLITICLHLPVSVLLAIPAVPPIYKLMFTFPLAALAASMAGRIFRKLKLKDIEVQSSKHLGSSNIVPLSRIQIQRTTMTSQSETSPPHSHQHLDHHVAVDFAPQKLKRAGVSSDDVRLARTEVWDMM